MACIDCNLPEEEMPIDTVLSHHQWDMITTREESYGTLCANCIVKRASKLKGIIVAKIYLDIVEREYTGEEIKDKYFPNVDWDTLRDNKNLIYEELKEIRNEDLYT